MKASQDIEVEGVTTFASSPTTSYRYVIQLKNDKMSIWMEDRVSKKQWYKGTMTKADYVTSQNIITDATPTDYLKCFQDALDCELNGGDEVQRELGAVKGGGIRLAFAVTIRVLRSTRVAKFVFDLDPVSVERIDVLESKLLDKQDELKRLREQFEHGQNLPFIQLTSSTKNATNLNLIWKMVQSDDFSVEDDGGVEIHQSGLYSIAAVINCVPSDYNLTVSLMKNDVCIQLAYCGMRGISSSAILGCS